MSVTVKTRIRYNGQDYASPAELPPEVRAAYEKALHDGVTRKRFIFNGQTLTNEETMPADVRKLCDDVMNVIERNGEVTIPNGDKSEPLLSKKEIVIVALFGLGIAALAAWRLISG